jgi:hypothetical protein
MTIYIIHYTKPDAKCSSCNLRVCHIILLTGVDPGFQVRRGGAHLKKLRLAEGGAKIFGVFRVKNLDFTPKNHIFSNFRGGGAWIRPWLLNTMQCPH